MKVSVWDTYVQREDGRRMHFDILVSSEFNDELAIFGFGKEYLKSKSIESYELTAKECRFCHIEQAPEVITEEVSKRGYAIIEMENCD